MGPVSHYCILALLPAYLEREGSSLVYMVDSLITKSRHSNSGFYLNNLDDLKKPVDAASKKRAKNPFNRS